MKRIKEAIRKDFSGVVVPFIPAAIALNLVAGQIVAILKLPLYLDSIGTVLVGALCGPWPGLLTGVMSNLIAGIIFNPIVAFFAPTAGIIGLVSGYLASKGFFKKLWLVILGGIIQGIIAALVSAPITAYVFGGITLAGTDFIVAYFRAIGKTLFESAFLSGMASDPVDKTMTYIIVFMMIKSSPASLIRRLPRSQNILIE
jgi:energy-coupling factor transport system substrate-specific component